MKNGRVLLRIDPNAKEGYIHKKLINYQHRDILHRPRPLFIIMFILMHSLFPPGRYLSVLIGHVNNIDCKEAHLMRHILFRPFPFSAPAHSFLPHSGVIRNWTSQYERLTSGNFLEQNQLNRLQRVQIECPRYWNPCLIHYWMNPFTRFQPLLLPLFLSL